jgi:membrane protein DedA with SNARE-associated domain
LLGRLKGRRLFELYCRLFRLSAPGIGAADRILRRFGALTLVVARLGATLRILVVPLAASRGMSYGRFVASDAMGAMLWATGCVWLGRALGVLASERGLGVTSAVIGALVTTSVLVSLLARRRLAMGGVAR